MLEMLRMMQQIEEDMSKAKWEVIPSPEGLDAKTIKGATDRWNFVIVSFSIEDQGFPEGSRGYDGAARCGSVIMHLPRETAEAMFRFAESRTS